MRVIALIDDPGVVRRILGHRAPGKIARRAHLIRGHIRDLTCSAMCRVRDILYRSISFADVRQALD